MSETGREQAVECSHLAPCTPTYRCSMHRPGRERADMTADGYWREVAHILAGPLARHLADDDPASYRRMVLAYIAAEPDGR